MLAPSVVGAIMNRSLLWSAVFLSVWNICSALLEYFLLRSIYKSVPRLGVEKKKLNKLTKFFNFGGFSTYARSFFLPGISFGLLYLTVLGFDSITIGYASEKGINEMVRVLSKFKLDARN